MTIKEVKEYLDRNANDNIYLADKLTMEGYGQTKGAYHNEAKKRNVINPKQKWRFMVSYYEYIKNIEVDPTFSKLHCPELLIWIAEVAGLKHDIIDRAINFLKEYENQNNLKQREKGGSYINSIEKEFKKLLHIYEINKIIGESKNWNNVKKKVSSIEN